MPLKHGFKVQLSDEMSYYSITSYSLWMHGITAFHILMSCLHFQHSFPVKNVTFDDFSLYIFIFMDTYLLLLLLIIIIFKCFNILKNLSGKFVCVYVYIYATTPVLKSKKNLHVGPRDHIQVVRLSSKYPINHFNGSAILKSGNNYCKVYNATNSL